MVRGRAIVAICAGLVGCALWPYSPSQRPASHQQDVGYDKQVRSPSYPPATWGDDPDPASAAVVDAQTVALRQQRQAIVDSPNLLTSLSEVSFSSGTIEKVAAVEVLLVCSTRRAATSDPANSKAVFASEELARRCGALTGLMSEEGAFRLAVDWMDSARRDSTILGSILALSQRRLAGGSHLYDDDHALLTRALASADDLLVLEAAQILEAQIADGTSAGDLRATAFREALASVAARVRSTDFDRLVDCANLAHCGSSNERIPFHLAKTSLTDRPEVARLARSYLAALSYGTASRELLAIK